jgi:Na+/H+ antiporter NhaC
MEYGVISLVVPLLTIILAIVTKDVVVSLLGGIFVGDLIIHNFSFAEAFISLFDGVISLLAEGWISKSVIFILLIGAIIRILQNSGAIDNFVAWITKKFYRVDSPIGAMLLAYILGVIIFIESSITSLIAGTVAKPLCDKNGVSREKLAYICDSTSAPICSLIPLNAWGALLLGLIVSAIDSGLIEGNGVELLISSIPYNFYAIFTLIIVLFVIFKDFNIGAMREAKAIPYIPKESKKESNSNPYMMILPLVIMVLLVPIGLYLSGGGDMFKGSGSTAVYYSVIVTLIFLYIYYIPKSIISHKLYFNSLYKGMGEMIPLATIIILALLIGSVIKELDTAGYLANLLSGNIPPIFIPLIIFLVSAITAFSTGTSWGTFSIMMPIALSLGATMDLNLSLVIASVISGGIFGDHASPISDTTIISSLASGCDHIEHVRTQLPYALLAGVLASIGFLVAGVV